MNTVSLFISYQHPVLLYVLYEILTEYWSIIQKIKCGNTAKSPRKIQKNPGRVASLDSGDEDLLPGPQRDSSRDQEFNDLTWYTYPCGDTAKNTETSCHSIRFLPLY